MARAVAECVRVRAGLVISPEPSAVPEGFDAIVGAHPVPTAASERAGRKALALADSVGEDDTLVVLLSGCASALMAVPSDHLTLDDKRATKDRLLKAGADIYALNTVRKHLSAIKGGRLAARARGRCRTLVISDVVGDDLSVIASGPTVGDASTFGDALEVLRRFGGEDVFPRAVVERLRRGVAGEIADTPTPGDPALAHATTTLIGSRLDALNGAAADAEARGYHVLRLDEPVIGDARTTAVAFLRAALAQTANAPRPTCVVATGETTVKVVGKGKGGRNQEFALATAELLGGVGTPVALASAGTDGIDGPTDAAGAVADQTTVHRAAAAGLALDSFLLDNNAYAFFDALGDLIHTGPTGTNVGDLQVILIA